MKKFMSLFLTVIMLLGIVSCSGTKSNEYTQILVTVNGQTYDLTPENEAGGNYQIIETPKVIRDAYSDEDVTTYYSKDSNTPYVVVYSWESSDYTLEQLLDYLVEDSDGSDAQYIYDNVGYYCFGYDVSKIFDGMTYAYCDSMVIKDGNKWTEVVYYADTEEFKLGDTGYYLWIPTGYTELNDFEEAILEIEYSEDYWFPYIYIECVTGDETYEDLKEYWSYEYPDGNLPVDEATYKQWQASDWNEDALVAYYTAFGLDSDLHFIDDIVNGCDVSATCGTRDGVAIMDGYITIGDEEFNVWLESDLNPEPRYMKALFNSLHTK